MYLKNDIIFLFRKHIETDNEFYMNDATCIKMKCKIIDVALRIYRSEFFHISVKFFSSATSGIELWDCSKLFIQYNQPSGFEL